jgi:hypothetical protein
MAQRVVFKVDEPVAALGVEVASVPVCVCACVCVCVVVRRLLGTPCTQGFTVPASGRGPQRPWSRRRAAGRRAVSTPPPPPPPRTRRHAGACGRVPAAPTAHGAAWAYKSRRHMSPRWVAVCRAHTRCESPQSRQYVTNKSSQNHNQQNNYTRVMCGRGRTDRSPMRHRMGGRYIAPAHPCTHRRRGLRWDIPDATQATTRDPMIWRVICCVATRPAHEGAMGCAGGQEPEGVHQVSMGNGLQHN